MKTLFAILAGILLLCGQVAMATPVGHTNIWLPTGDGTYCEAFGVYPNQAPYTHFDKVQASGDNKYVKQSGDYYAGRRDSFRVDGPGVNERVPDRAIANSISVVLKCTAKGDLPNPGNALQMGVVINGNVHEVLYWSGLTGDNYTTFSTGFEDNPETGYPWTPDEVNNIEIYYRIQSVVADSTYVDKFWAEVSYQTPSESTNYMTTWYPTGDNTIIGQGYFPNSNIVYPTNPSTRWDKLYEKAWGDEDDAYIGLTGGGVASDWFDFDGWENERVPDGATNIWIEQYCVAKTVNGDNDEIGIELKVSSSSSTEGEDGINPTYYYQLQRDQYLYFYTTARSIDPATNQNWTPAGINAAAFGMMQFSAEDTDSRVSSMAVRVHYTYGG